MFNRSLPVLFLELRGLLAVRLPFWSKEQGTIAFVANIAFCMCLSLTVKLYSAFNIAVKETMAINSSLDHGAISMQLILLFAPVICQFTSFVQDRTAKPSERFFHAGFVADPSCLQDLHPTFLHRTPIYQKSRLLNKNSFGGCPMSSGLMIAGFAAIGPSCLQYRTSLNGVVFVDLCISCCIGASVALGIVPARTHVQRKMLEECYSSAFESFHLAAGLWMLV